jgi:HK97 family phage portal protein
MHALGKVLAVSDRGAFSDFWYEPADRSASGGPITLDSAMTIPQFYAAVTYVSEDNAKLPLNLFEDMGKAGTEPARGHELSDLLHFQPNRRQTAIEWREMVTAWAMLRGMGVSEIITGDPISYPSAPTRSGAVDQLVPLHPDLIREEQTRGSRKLIYRDPKLGGDERTILPEDAFIVRGRQSRSVLDFARTNLGTTLGRERYEGFLFSRGAKHQGVITAKGKLQDPVRKALRRALDEYSIGGPRAGRPLLLEDGMTWENVSMTAHDAQLLDLKQLSIADACRWIRIPPHKVFDLTRSTNNNIESQGVDYVVDCQLAWAVRWELAIWRDLIVDKRYFAKLMLDGLLRGNAEDRAKAYSLAIMWGWMTRNEVRRKEDLNPIDGLDEPLTPINMTTDPDGGTKVGYAPQALLTAGPISATDRGRLQLIAADTAGRIVRREMAEVGKIAKRTEGDQAAFRVAVGAFYDEHRDHVASSLHIPDHQARRYVAHQAEALAEGGIGVMDDWLTDRAGYLTALAMDQEELAA